MCFYVTPSVTFDDNNDKCNSQCGRPVAARKPRHNRPVQSQSQALPRHPWRVSSNLDLSLVLSASDKRSQYERPFYDFDRLRTRDKIT